MLLEISQDKTKTFITYKIIKKKLFCYFFSIYLFQSKWPYKNDGWIVISRCYILYNFVRNVSGQKICESQMKNIFVCFMEKSKILTN